MPSISHQRAPGQLKSDGISGTLSAGPCCEGDVREVASIFVYVLCSLSIRGNAQKFFGNAPPKSEALTN